MQSLAVNLLNEMLAIYSPTGCESELSHFLLKKMNDLGIKTHIDNAGNVLGEFGKGDPSILLCGHMDTVSGKLPVKREENRLYGRGAVDAKASLAAMIFATWMLKKEKFPGKLIIAGVVDEEGEGRGARQLIKNDLEVDYAVFGEPSGVDQITIAYKGSLRVKISVKTVTGHSSAPWLFDNAVERAFEVFELLRKIRFSSERKDSKFFSITSSLTKIEGGSSFSKVPSKCIFYIDFRVPPQIAPSKLFDEIMQIIRKYRKNMPTVTLNAEILDACNPYEADTKSLLLHSLSWAIRIVREKPATWVRKTGTSDMNLLGVSMNVPVVAYGPGDSSLDHTSTEWVDLKDYVDSIFVLCKGIKRLTELHNRRIRKQSS